MGHRFYDENDKVRMETTSDSEEDINRTVNYLLRHKRNPAQKVRVEKYDHKSPHVPTNTHFSEKKPQPGLSKTPSQLETTQVIQDPELNKQTNHESLPKHPSVQLNIKPASDVKEDSSKTVNYRPKKKFVALQDMSTKDLKYLYEKHFGKSTNSGYTPEMQQADNERFKLDVNELRNKKPGSKQPNNYKVQDDKIRSGQMKEGEEVELIVPEEDNWVRREMQQHYPLGRAVIANQEGHGINDETVVSPIGENPQNVATSYLRSRLRHPRPKQKAFREEGDFKTDNPNKDTQDFERTPRKVGDWVGVVSGSSGVVATATDEGTGYITEILPGPSFQYRVGRRKESLGTPVREDEISYPTHPKPKQKSLEQMSTKDLRILYLKSLRMKYKAIDPEKVEKYRRNVDTSFKDSPAPGTWGQENPNADLFYRSMDRRSELYEGMSKQEKKEGDEYVRGLRFRRRQQNNE